MIQANYFLRKRILICELYQQFSTYNILQNGSKDGTFYIVYHKLGNDHFHAWCHIYYTYGILPNFWLNQICFYVDFCDLDFFVKFRIIYLSCSQAFKFA